MVQESQQISGRDFKESGGNMKLEPEKMIGMYQTMLRIRRFEEKVMDMYARQLIPGITHLYIGEEAVATGVCANLKTDDYITSTHRGHGHCIAKGGELKMMMAELFGKTTGYCHGKGGSMHIANIDLGILGANGIVAAGMPIAGGAALAIKMRKGSQVVVSFFGDGACNQGAFHESLNLAAVWKLPVVFVCENNLYGISVAAKRVGSIQDYYLRKASYGIEGCKVDGNDLLAVYEAAGEAVSRAREGKGPTLIECKTYRWRGHYEGEADRTFLYRPKEEIEEWMKKCPIDRFKKFLLEKKVSKETNLKKIDEQIQGEIEEAIEYAKNSPDPNPEDALRDVYCE
jgi:pyruvate dehydrogenase E1 component alpha subunit